ncbi:multidrug resistance-associated protein 4 [Anoplophora glabripennis]|nr:multidrug resistance-associated protein 4 [Anoplophora glabripennis]
MNAGFQLEHENPKQNANCISKLFFAWMIKLFYKGTQKGLEVVDLYKALDCDKSSYVGDKLEKNWDDEVKKAKLKGSKPSLMRALIKTFIWKYMLCGLLQFIQMVVLRSVQPVILAYYISLYAISEDRADKTDQMYISGAGIVAISILVCFLMHHTNFAISAIGMRIRIAASSLIYRKITRLNQQSLGKTATGQVVNLLSNDVNRFDLVILFLHYVWIMPFQVALITYFIWREVGISSLAGVVSMALFTLPVQGYLGKLTGKLRLKVANKTDTRVKLMSEIISGIQVIKMYAWEKPFEQVIKLARGTEINSLTKTSYLRAIFSSCNVFIERTTLFLTVICFVLLGNIISADKVFSMAQFFNILQLAMAIIYPMAISYGAEAWVSVKRLQEFLILDEKQQANIESHNEKEIQITNVSASWVPNVPVLKNIDIHIPPNTLCAIVGPVGAGKSSILQLILGELPQTSGRIYLGGKISYSSQEPWLFGSTVRNNILFGQPYNKFLYQKIVHVCALQKDFEQFPEGDKTVVGERGVSLSGGQRARINLARAVYRQADIYIMDDPLSAVDTHVGRHLFNECIVNYLKDKTRILVTHQLQYLKKADLIIVINEGKIEAQGTFDELSNSKMDFTKLLAVADETTEKTVEKHLDEHIIGLIDPRRTSVLSIANSTLSETIEIAQAVENEEESGGNSGISPFKEYFKAAGNICLIIILLTCIILSQAACTGADFWVAFWTGQEEIRHSNNSILLRNSLQQPILETIEVYDTASSGADSSYYTYTIEKNQTRAFSDIFDSVQVDNITHNLVKTDVAMYFYGGLIVAAIVITLARALLFFKIAMRASKRLHSKMFHALLKAPMRFFDTNPSGRVLNRFSKDMGAIDEILPRVLWDAVQIVLVMIGILINVGISNQYMIIAMVVLGAVFLKIRSWYIATARDVKHLEGITKSPVFSHISSTLNGIITIRASKAEEVLINEFDYHQDIHTSAWYLTITCVVSFGLWLDIICVIFVACVVFSFAIMQTLSIVSGSLVGLAVSQSLVLTGMLQHGMRQTAEVINQLTSVERVLQYTTIDTEGPFETPPGKMPALPWPNQGLIEFINLSLKYIADDPPVLKNLNFTIYPGEKIGIVGRTGAGKSSLIAALFRLAPLEGTILIDGVDTQQLGLNDLRKRISIIPQEPVLFSATLRYNLDPFKEFQDTELWNALDEVELKEAVSSLDFLIAEGGSNFSLGQRQLICLARAILRNSKVLVLDEATANVDPRTDSFIQATIRRKFKHCTVLTIAHRLNTIMDSDKVMVMAGGSMLEFDHPHSLLQTPEGPFHKMVLETGPTMSIQLKDIAQEAYKQKKNL